MEAAAVTSRKRSVAWCFFKPVNSRLVQCLLCTGLQSIQQGSTTPMLRHLRFKHPEEVAKKFRGDMDLSVVDSALEDGDPDMPDETMNGSDISPAVADVQAAAEGDPAGRAHGEASDDGENRSVRCARNKRSLVWRHFEHLDRLNAARCLVCKKELQCYKSGGTSNLRRHMLKRHPAMFAQVVADGLKSGSKANGDASTEQRQHSVTGLEDGDPDMPDETMNGSDISPAVADVQAAAEGDPAGRAHGEASDDDSPVRCTRNKRSLVWRHFEHLDSLNAARCLVCMKKLQCCESGGTSNLRRHMMKRHPEMFAQLVAEGLKSSRGSKAISDASTEQRQHSGVLPRSRALAGEKQLLKRERELIEALRRTQKEEARALEHQRELLEKLRAADAREVAAEWKKINTLRKAQQEEAEELSRQRKELQRERTELRYSCFPQDNDNGLRT